MTAPHALARPVLKVRPSRAFAFLLMSLMALAALARPAFAATEATPEQAYVTSISDRAIKILTDKSLDKATRDKTFQTLILDNIALERIAPFALGRYAAAMRASGRYDEYSSLFGQYIARVYAARLNGYSGQHLQVDKSTVYSSDFVVYSTIQPGAEGGDPIAVNWRLERNGETFRIVDVQVIGAWMSIEQRDQFASIISNNNRDVLKLLDYLRQQTAEGAPPPPAANTANNNAPTGATTR